MPIRLVEGIKGDMLNDEGAGTHGRGNENCPNQVARSGGHRPSPAAARGWLGCPCGAGLHGLVPGWVARHHLGGEPGADWPWLHRLVCKGIRIAQPCPNDWAILIYISIDIEKQKNIFTVFYFLVLIITYIYCKIDM